MYTWHCTCSCTILYVSTVLSDCSHAYAFYAVSLLKASKDVDLNKYHSLIEDMVAQADEIDDVMMRFEGGLLPTALLVDSSYRLADAVKKGPTISDVSRKIL